MSGTAPGSKDTRVNKTDMDIAPRESILVGRHTKKTKL